MLAVKGKKVAVIGLSKRTGVAAASMLVEHGAKVVASDVKTEDKLKEELDMLAGKDIEFELGGHGEKSLAADLIVVSPGVPLDIPFFKEARKKKIPIISEIELAYHFTDAKIIAITGTNGKTTTTSLLGKILKEAFPQHVKVAGNIGTPLVQEAVGMKKDEWLVVEVSSFQLETIREFKPDISIYLNFTPDHLDRHKTVENYWQAKKRIFMNQSKGDLALINYDDHDVMRAAKECRARKYYVSTNKKVNNGLYIDGENLKIVDNGKKNLVISVQNIPLPGEHNLKNVAFATLAAHLIGVDREAICKVIKEFKLASHRLDEFGRDNDGTVYIDDSKATNPDAALKALKAYEKPVILIAGGQDRNADFSLLAEEINDKVKYLILLGETKEKIKKEVLAKGYPEKRIKIVKDMQQAVKEAFIHKETGDCVLLSPACPSWDMYESYKERGKEFQQAVNRLRGH